MRAVPPHQKFITDRSKAVFLMWFSVACFGVRVLVMFHLRFVHYTLSSVWVAEWPPFGIAARLVGHMFPLSFVYL